MVCPRPHGNGPACTERLAHPIATPLNKSDSCGRRRSRLDIRSELAARDHRVGSVYYAGGAHAGEMAEMETARRRRRAAAFGAERYVSGSATHSTPEVHGGRTDGHRLLQHQPSHLPVWITSFTSWVGPTTALVMSVCCRRTVGHGLDPSVNWKERKERKWTCIAPIVSITRPLSAQMWITQSYLQIHHICLSFVYAFARGRTAGLHGVGRMTATLWFRLFYHFHNKPPNANTYTLRL